MESHVDYNRHSCYIKLHRLPFPASDSKVILAYTLLPFRTYMKFRWYFRYRAALIQVQHPKQYVEIVEIQVRINPKDKEKISLKNKIISAKAQITKIDNAIKLAEKNYKPNLLEPTLQDTVAYKKAMDKRDQTLLKLKQLEIQLLNAL